MVLQFTPRVSHTTPRFPNAIRWYRLQRGLTQAGLALRLQLGRSLVSLWERGQRLPPMSVLPRIARELGVLADLLYPSISPEDRKERRSKKSDRP